MMRTTIANTLLAALAFSACASAGFAHAADAELLIRSSTPLPTYNAEETTQAPRIARVIQSVRATACAYRYDLARGRIAALSQLQALALKGGANGLSNVRFLVISNARSPCWHGVETTGLAVIYER